MDLLLLGTGTTIPFGDRGCAAYALEAADGSILLIDCGPGSSRRYPMLGLDPRRVVGVAITHHHVDHVGDLPLFLFLRNVAEPPIESPLALLGPRGHGRFLDGLASTYAPGIADLAGTHARHELSDGTSCDVGPFRITAREVAHLPHALGYRVEADDTSFAFSGDTGPCEALVELAAGVDLAVFECSYAPTRESTGHLTSRTASQLASRARPRRLVLSHFYPEVLATDIEADVRAAGYEGPLVLGTDGSRIPVGP